MIGLSYYKYVTKLVKKIKLNTTRILRMLVVFNIIFFTRFVTLTCYGEIAGTRPNANIKINSYEMAYLFDYTYVVDVIYDFL